MLSCSHIHAAWFFCVVATWFASILINLLYIYTGQSYDETVDIFSFGIVLCEVSPSYIGTNRTPELHEEQEAQYTSRHLPFQPTIASVGLASIGPLIKTDGPWCRKEAGAPEDIDYRI